MECYKRMIRNAKRRPKPYATGELIRLWLKGLLATSFIMLFNWIVGEIRLAENKKALKEFKEEQLKNEKFRRLSGNPRQFNCRDESV